VELRAMEMIPKVEMGAESEGLHKKALAGGEGLS
jgi:hypothetical protein